MLAFYCSYKMAYIYGQVRVGLHLKYKEKKKFMYVSLRIINMCCNQYITKTLYISVSKHQNIQPLVVYFNVTEFQICVHSIVMLIVNKWKLLPCLASLFILYYMLQL